MFRRKEVLRGVWDVFGMSLMGFGRCIGCVREVVWWCMGGFGRCFGGV